MNVVGRTARTLQRILHTRYPGFLFGLPLSSSEIPIFNFHDVTRESLARDLAFLKRNGYRTLSLDEFLERGGRSSGRREVLLTFDDARASVYREGLPVLREFGSRAVLFVPTFWMRADDGSMPRQGQALFMSWEEVKRCRESGVFDVESHAHRHTLVHVAPHVVEFATPETIRRYDIYDWPMRRAGEAAEHGFPPLGTPVYRAMPLLSAQRCYVESDAATRACQELVDSGGGERFFEQPDALVQLRETHSAAFRHDQGHYLEPAALDALVQSEFELSKQAFIGHLGYAPRCLAFPWRVGSVRALEHARRAGIVATFGCALDFRHDRNALPLPVYGRFRCDWLRLLPGEDRISLAGVVAHKLAGITHQHLAH
ncbi:MAG TPA: polysaccharide deacetylase family protein [Steroidobacteraceae bacterium]